MFSMANRMEINEKDKLKKHMLLDKLMDSCYIKQSTHNFFCKKCDCEVTIDWAKNEAYCLVDGSICTYVKDEEIKEPVTIVQNDKVWLLMGDAKYSETK